MTEHRTPHTTIPAEQHRWTSGGHPLGSEPHSGPVPLAYEPAGAQILLVEDDDPVRMLLVRVLRRAGYAVVDAANGAVAMELINGFTLPRIHLLITDISMPQIGGIELARRLRAGGHVQQVLFMTGYAEAGSVCNDEHTILLHKPFTPRTFTAAVSAMLARQFPRANSVGYSE